MKALRLKIGAGCKGLLKDPFVSTLLYATIFFAIFCVIFNFVLYEAFVPSSSMVPTISCPSLNFGNRLAYMAEEPQQGDIIYFRSEEEGGNIVLVKRIIGTPGDVVEEKDGVIYINGTPLQENYLNEQPEPLDFGPYIVPADSYFVLGDNRNHSHDSRYWEYPFVNKSDILAKHLLSIG